MPNWIHWQGQDDKIRDHAKDADYKREGGEVDATHRDSIVPFCIDWQALEYTDHAGGDSTHENKCSYDLMGDIEPSLGEDAMIEV